MLAASGLPSHASSVCPGGLAGLAPDAARGHLDQRQQVGDAVSEGAGVAVSGSARRVRRAQFSAGAWPFFDESAAHRQQFIPVHAFQGAAERAALEEGALEDGLQDGAQRQVVVGRREVDGRAHERRRGRRLRSVIRLASCFGAKAFEPRPEADVGVDRLLRLHANEMLDCRCGGHL